MTLNDIYLISQVLAVIALVPSVIYLAVQVRQNTLQARASASYQFLETNKDLNLALIENKQMASVYRRGIEDFGALDVDEKTQFFFFIGQYYQAFSNMHDLWKTHMLPDSAWYPIRKHLLSMMTLPGTRYIWEVYARGGQAPDFVAYVEALHASGEETYSLKDFFEVKAPEEKAQTETSL